MTRISIDAERCTLCGLCIPDCVRGILAAGERTVEITDPSLCIQCGHCRALCPVDAPKYEGLDEMEFQEISGAPALPDADELLFLFRSRRSIRQYKKSLSVSRDAAERIIEAGRFAPTGGNRQAVSYVAVLQAEKLASVRQLTIDILAGYADRIDEALRLHREEGKAIPREFRIRRVYGKRWKELKALLLKGDDRLFYNAPAFMALHLNPAESSSAAVDAGLAAMQMVLMAETLGLGTCFCGFFCFAVAESLQLKEALGIPARHVVPVSFVLGHPDVNYHKLVARSRPRINWF
ncbi:MAG: nitroreductase family protein [Deltaproteobacteria bacterium]|nr:nitroreductase family protein [Deltaproteobacteria bacterium]